MKIFLQYKRGVFLKGVSKVSLASLLQWETVLKLKRKNKKDRNKRRNTQRRIQEGITRGKHKIA